ncbi:hypothetical protein H4Q26_016244, partial [Puccinia striiformis f. sp. tritici PST-130]
ILGEDDTPNPTEHNQLAEHNDDNERGEHGDDERTNPRTTAAKREVGIKEHDQVQRPVGMGRRIRSDLHPPRSVQQREETVELKTLNAILDCVMITNKNLSVLDSNSELNYTTLVNTVVSNSHSTREAIEMCTSQLKTSIAKPVVIPSELSEKFITLRT